MLIRRQLVKSKANELLAKWGCGAGAVDIRNIARLEGLEIHEDKTPKDNLSGFLFIEGSRKLIGINNNDGEERKRFTIAHELGHYFLHAHSQGTPHVDKSSNISSTYFRDSNSSTGMNAEEIEANLFAAEILMPEYHVNHKLNSLLQSQVCCGEDIIRTLADDFKVSEQAMIVRLTSLKLLKI